MPVPDDDFEPNKALLNPFFESYRLESDVLDLQEVATFRAAAPIGRVLQGGDGESRLGWREAKSRAAWNHLCVSTDAKEAAWIDQEAVVWLCSWDDKGNDCITQLASLPTPIESSASFEYPSIISLGQARWLVSDGTGRIYVLHHSQIQSQAECTKQDGSLRPFRLHTAFLSEQTVKMIISYSGVPEDSKEAIYYVSCATCSITSDTTASLQTQWTLSGSDIPSYVSLTSQECIIGSGCLFNSSAPSPSEPSITPAHETTTNGTPSQAAAQPEKYTWTQDVSCITLQFPLPTHITSSHISIAFSPLHLTVLIKDHTRISHRQLLHPINSAESTWTFDPEDHTLVVSLEKVEGDSARWLGLFSDGGPEESFTQEKLEEMRGLLSHMTNEGGGAAGGLLGEEEELEDSTGLTMFTYSDEKGEVKTGTGVEVLSHGLSDDSLVVKRSYDGLLFEPKWRHVSTYPALAYVLASKRSLNMRFILHHQDKFCIAIESGGNVWAYFPPPPGQRVKIAKQAVARLDDDLGAVLGCGLLEGVGVVLLCDKGLCVLKGLM